MNEAAEIALEMQSKQLAPLIEFMRQPVQDVAASEKAGHYVAKDVDFVIITQRNGKGDNIIWKVSTWLANWEQEVVSGRLPKPWLDRAKANYERFRQGQEIPLDGIPIKGWGVLSPAQQEMLIRLNIRTVEHLASLNDEGRMKIGMGAMDLQRKAAAWLAATKDKGHLTMEMAALQRENDLKNGQIETLQRQLAELSARVNAIPQAAVTPVQAPTQTTDKIDVDKMLDELNAEPKVTGTPPQRPARRRAKATVADTPPPVKEADLPAEPAPATPGDSDDI